MGIHIGVEEAETAGGEGNRESRVYFAVGNPPQKDHLLQVMEVFNRLNLGVRRAYTLTISTGSFPYFLGTFYVIRREGGLLEKDTPSSAGCAANSTTRRSWPPARRCTGSSSSTRLMTGDEASLVNAFIGFCHTSLAHNQLHRFTLEDVSQAFHSHPEITLQLRASSSCGSTRR